MPIHIGLPAVGRPQLRYSYPWDQTVSGFQGCSQEIFEGGIHLEFPLNWAVFMHNLRFMIIIHLYGLGESAAPLNTPMQISLSLCRGQAGDI